ncbi:DUF982 domain-containing protein [Mesorhizobium waimense]|uniref:DUF982 domain-containing protein n=1 Tax=Mesorhizobium waimense TaxID=1300307 RepID=A0A3A5JNV1_9HYPH|nr:DUF982 domain-containing protein [Mesorhizobium waimense]RJT21453.1 DUF982 domain-containing protein [Mesorhizobium waimense]
MSAFLPIRIRFADGRLMQVSSICEAEKALGGRWENKEKRTFKEAARLLAAAREGGCKPQVAFQAFKRAAREQSMLQSVKRSSALKMYDELVRSLC